MGPSFSDTGAQASQPLAADVKLQVGISFALEQVNTGLQDTVWNEKPKAHVAKDLFSKRICDCCICLFEAVLRM